MKVNLRIMPFRQSQELGAAENCALLQGELGQPETRFVQSGTREKSTV